MKWRSLCAQFSAPVIRDPTSVDVDLARDRQDYQSTLLQMRRFCEGNCRGQFDWRAPRSTGQVTFDFADSTDALLFKMRYA